MQQPHLHGRQPRLLESGQPHDVVRTRRPREVVDVLLDEAMRRRLVRVVASLALDAGRADHPALRHGQLHVVDAVVREELGARVELVAVPALVLEHADFRKPLGEEEEAADDARAGDRPRDLRRPLEIDLDGFARRHRAWQRHRHHRLIVGVPVVRRDVAAGGGEVNRRRAALAGQFDLRDLRPAPVPRAETTPDPAGTASPRSRPRA